MRSMAIHTLFSSFLVLFLMGTVVNAQVRSVEQLIDATGDGQGNVLDQPIALAMDQNGAVYVVGSDSDNAFRIDPDGTITQILEASGDGAGNVCDDPWDIKIDAFGNACVACDDSWNVFRISPQGVVTEIVDATGDGAGNPLEYPRSLAVDTQGNVFVAGFGSNNVLRVAPDGTVTEVLGPTGNGVASLERPRDVIVEDDVLYVAGYDSKNVFKVEPDGTTTLIDLSPFLDRPYELAFSPTGSLWVIDSKAQPFPQSPSIGIIELTPEGVIDASGISGSDSLAFDQIGTRFQAGPEGLYKTPAGNLSYSLVEEEDIGTRFPMERPIGTIYRDPNRLWIAGYSSDNVLSMELVWSHLGGESAGSEGPPTLDIIAKLEPLSDFHLRVDNLPSGSTPMLAWVAFDPSPVQLLGGTVHAFPPATEHLLVAAVSNLFVGTTWPHASPSGLELTIQFLVQDFSAPDGITLTNALTATVP